MMPPVHDDLILYNYTTKYKENYTTKYKENKSDN